MAKKEPGVCRICNEYGETSEFLEPVCSFSNIVADIKDTLGIEIIEGPDTPTYVCPECISSLEIVRKFRQKCIRSNEFYALISNLSKEDCHVLSDEIKLNSGDPELNHVQSSYVEQLNDPSISITIEEHIAQEASDKTDESLIINNQESTSGNRIRRGVKRKCTIEVEKKDKPSAPVICDICGNVFKAKHVFALHLRRHSNHKPYDCELCSSRFYTNSELKRHMRRHTGEKPYQCQHCHRKFSDYGTLTKHIRTHTNDRPFPCKQCGKSFSCAFVLKNHMLTHTGERAFRCEVCDKSFGRLHNLTTHMKSIYHQRNICLKENKTDIS